MSSQTIGNYAAINGLNLYYEIHGEGEPLILLHGGLGAIDMFTEILPRLGQGHQVIGVDLQAHGRTADTERPLRLEYMADDIAALMKHLNMEYADVMGYSLGGGVALRTAIQHPDLVRKLVVVSFPFKRSGSYPDVLLSMDKMGAEAAEMMKPSPIYKLYSQIAPRPEDWPRLLAKMGDLLRQEYDWSEEVAQLTMPVLLVFGDADSVPASHMAEFYRLLGGSQKDAGWNHAHMPKSQLAVLPGTSHYSCFSNPLLTEIATGFLNSSAK